ncbi:transmembrane protein 61 isoform X2 [Pleurodeles waltl]|uniref:transmembrane protein 61 isoform X2 n=1 Tax=Pleurodeles waltl TaxID=8319 RepID=UPI0037098DB6
MTSSFRHGVTITGTVLLVTGTLCFAWWSDGETALLASNTSRAEPEMGGLLVTPASHTSSNSLLRSVSFFCCGVGGLLLLFGLLWSVKENSRTVRQRYQYHLPQELHYISRELSEKLTNSAGPNTIPSYEEATSCSLAENPQRFPPNHFVNSENFPPLYETLTGNDWRPGYHKRSLSDSALLRNLHHCPHQQLDHRGAHPGMIDTPPPSYEKINDHMT